MKIWNRARADPCLDNVVPFVGFLRINFSYSTLQTTDEVSVIETIRRFPAEWEEQDAVLMAWPHEGTDWVPTSRRCNV